MTDSVFLSLGSNLGNREVSLNGALERLARRGVRIEVRSSLYETEPVDFKPQPPFLNLVCRSSTSLDPGGLLACCKSIERDLGRRPSPPKGPRPIDIDILIFGRIVLSSPVLTIPHPSLAVRRFVLAPLAEIAPELIDPRSGHTIARLLEDCPDRSAVVPWAVRGDAEASETVEWGMPPPKRKTRRH
jgi:2-amino-4-hydroxy-6-hydroxymethyldihydropteridine diphosphokinase